MRARIPVWFLAAALALSAGAAVAQMPDVPPGKWWKRPAVVKELALSADQQEKLEQIFAKNRREFVDLKADAEKRQFDLEELMAKKDSDPKKVTAAIDALEQSRAKLRKSVSLMILEMRGVLSAEQWQKIVERREQWREERREQMRESRPGRGGAGPRSGAGPGGPPASRPPDEPKG